MGGSMSGAVVSSVISLVGGGSSSRGDSLEEERRQRQKEKQEEEARERRKERIRVREARSVEAAQLQKKQPETLVNGGSGVQGRATVSGAALKTRLGE